MSKGKINYEVILPGSKVFFVGQRAIWDGTVKTTGLIILSVGDPVIRYDVEYFDEDGERVILEMPPRDVFETKAELLASLASDE